MNIDGHFPTIKHMHSNAGYFNYNSTQLYLNARVDIIAADKEGYTMFGIAAWPSPGMMGSKETIERLQAPAK